MLGPRLHWTDPQGNEQVYHLGTADVLIGRKTDANIALSDPHVSRIHAKIVGDEEGYCLLDLGSTQGTYVNGQRVQRHLLQHGDRVALGKGWVELFYFTRDTETTRPSSRAREKSLADLSLVLPAESSELEKISCLLDFQYQWGHVFTPEKAFEQILASALKISGAERGFILLKKPDGFGYAVGIDGRGRLLSQSEFRTSQSVVQQVATDEKPVFMVEHIEEKFAEQASIVAMGLRAIACLPLFGLPAAADRPTILGILYLDSTHAMQSLSGLDQKILSKLAVEAGNVLEKVEMLKGFEERNKLEQELALAEETQKGLLPQSLPQLEPLRIHAFSKPTRYVGGDFYDFLQPNPNEVIGVLGDVSGKGVSASLLSSMFLGCLEMLLHSGETPEQALVRLNQFLCEKSSPSRFITLFVFVLNTDGIGKFISAGHNTAYLFRRATGELDELASNNLILGAFDFASFRSTPLQLQEGDVLITYSDGLTEAENPEGEMLGEERLKDVIRREALVGAGCLEQRLLETIQDFTRGRAQTDDITLVILEKARAEVGSPLH